MFAWGNRTNVADYLRPNYALAISRKFVCADLLILFAVKVE
jgi:hypothetical protein